MTRQAAYNQAVFGYIDAAANQDKMAKDFYMICAEALYNQMTGVMVRNKPPRRLKKR